MTWLWELAVAACLGLCLGATCNTNGPGPSPATGGTQSTGGAAPSTGGEGGVNPGNTGGSPPGPPPTEAELVCGHLADVGCPQADCVRLVEQYQSDPRFTLDTDCLLLADSPAMVERCGSALCEVP